MAQAGRQAARAHRRQREERGEGASGADGGKNTEAYEKLHELCITAQELDVVETKKVAVGWFRTCILVRGHFELVLGC